MRSIIYSEYQKKWPFNGQMPLNGLLSYEQVTRTDQKTHTKARRAAVNLIGPIDWKGAIDPIATERYHGAR